jgi:hypothetical protein
LYDYWKDGLTPDETIYYSIFCLQCVEFFK